MATNPNQQNATQNAGAAKRAISSLNSGGTGSGAYFSTAAAYLGSKMTRYWRNSRSVYSLEVWKQTNDAYAYDAYDTTNQDRQEHQAASACVEAVSDGEDYGESFEEEIDATVDELRGF